MNIKNVLSTFCCALAFVALSVPGSDSEAADLPFLGRKNARECKTGPLINLPSDPSLSLSYEADAECSTIFIYPPELTVEIPTQHVSLTPWSRQCPAHFQLMKDMAKIGFTAGQVEGMYDPNIRNEAPVMTEQEVRERIRKNDLYRKLMRSEIKAHGNAPVVYVNGIISMSSKWDKIVSAMAEANPNYQVRKMPVYFGALAFETIPSNIGSEDEELYFATAQEGVIRRKVLGQKISQIDFDKLSVFGPVLDFSDSPVFFDNSVNFELVLNKFAGCSFDVDGDQRLDNVESMGGRLATTLTYYYPVQTEAYIEVRPNTSAIVALLDRYRRENAGIVTAAAFINDLKNAAGIEITISEDATGSDFAITEEVKRAIRTEILANTAEQILSQIGSVVTSASQIYQYAQHTTASSTDCDRGILGTGWGRKCDTRTWVVTTLHTDWNKAINAISDSLGQGNLGSKTAVRRVYLFGGTISSRFLVTGGQK